MTHFSRPPPDAAARGGYDKTRGRGNGESTRAELGDHGGWLDGETGWSRRVDYLTPCRHRAKAGKTHPNQSRVFPVAMPQVAARPAGSCACAGSLPFGG